MNENYQIRKIENGWLLTFWGQFNLFQHQKSFPNIQEVCVEVINLELKKEIEKDATK